MSLLNKIFQMILKQIDGIRNKHYSLDRANTLCQGFFLLSNEYQFYILQTKVNGLKAIQKGKEGHYEIVPTKPMTLNVIIFAYTYIHYIAPYINRFFNNFFVSWGIILIIVGIWGILAKVVLLQSVFINDNYKWQNYFFMLLGCLLLVFGIVKNLSFY